MSFCTEIVGKRKWNKEGKFEFQATEENIQSFRRAFPKGKIIDNRLKKQIKLNRRGQFKMRTTPYDHQQRAFDQCRDRSFFALFMEQGTGKTKVAIDKIAHHWLQGAITGVLIVSKSRVHQQWVEEQLPEHMPENVPWRAFVYDKHYPEVWPFLPDQLAVMTINYEALINMRGYLAAKKFIEICGGRVMMICDESHRIKQYNAKRTEACVQLGEMCTHRFIMTGTPIAKNLEDEWSQIKFLNPTIIGHETVTTFRAEYSVRRGSGRAQFTVASKNIPKFKAITAPHVFRVLRKDCLDLPPQQWRKWSYKASDEQHRLYDELTKRYVAEIGEQQYMSVQHAAVASLRKQQVICGLVVNNVDGQEERIRLPDNPRLDALMDLVDHLDEEKKVCIWSRFVEDIHLITQTIGEDKCVKVHGAVNDAGRALAVKRFIGDDKIKFLVANVQTAGTGLNLHLGGCCNAIYYSNDFNSIDRWQSEGRFHRIGTKETVTYWDLYSDLKFCHKIIKNLRSKKELADLVLDLAQEDVA